MKVKAAGCIMLGHVRTRSHRQGPLRPELESTDQPRRLNGEFYRGVRGLTSGAMWCLAGLWDTCATGTMWVLRTLLKRREAAGRDIAAALEASAKK